MEEGEGEARGGEPSGEALPSRPGENEPGVLRCVRTPAQAWDPRSQLTWAWQGGAGRPVWVNSNQLIGRPHPTDTPRTTSPAKFVLQHLLCPL